MTHVEYFLASWVHQQKKILSSPPKTHAAVFGAPCRRTDGRQFGAFGWLTNRPITSQEEFNERWLVFDGYRSKCRCVLQCTRRPSFHLPQHAAAAATAAAAAMAAVAQFRCESFYWRWPVTQRRFPELAESEYPVREHGRRFCSWVMSGRPWIMQIGRSIVREECLGSVWCRKISRSHLKSDNFQQFSIPRRLWKLLVCALLRSREWDTYLCTNFGCSNPRSVLSKRRQAQNGE